MVTAHAGMPVQPTVVESIFFFPKQYQQYKNMIVDRLTSCSKMINIGVLLATTFVDWRQGSLHLENKIVSQSEY